MISLLRFTLDLFSPEPVKVAETVEKFKPNLVCVSSTILYHLDRTAREFSGFRKTAQELNTSIALGGAGFSGEIRKRFDADFYADDFQKLETFATSLLT